MAKKTKRRRPTSALQTFINAQAFQLAARTLDAQPKKDILLWPVVVNEAFSLELHIKCLHRVRRRYIEGHNIRVIFDRLSKADRRNISRRFATFVEQHPKYEIAVSEGIAFDIDSVLQRASDMFTKGRYWHEGVMPSRDSHGHSSNAGIGSLSDAIRDFIYEIHPEWLQMVMNLKFKFPGNTRLST